MHFFLVLRISYRFYNLFISHSFHLSMCHLFDSQIRTHFIQLTQINAFVYYQSWLNWEHRDRIQHGGCDNNSKPAEQNKRWSNSVCHKTTTTKRKKTARCIGMMTKFLKLCSCSFGHLFFRTVIFISHSTIARIHSQSAQLNLFLNI